MWGPDKYQEETPELMAAIQELQARINKLDLAHDNVRRISEGIVAAGFYRPCTFEAIAGFYIDVFNRRAYTLNRGESVYADPDLIFNHVLPALRQMQVLDDIAESIKEPSSDKR